MSVLIDLRGVFGRESLSRYSASGAEMLWAALAGIGASFLVGSVALALLGPLRSSLYAMLIPSPHYDSFTTLLALSTAIGATAGTPIAFARGGLRAVALFALYLAAIASGGVIQAIQMAEAAAGPMMAFRPLDIVLPSQPPTVLALVVGLAIGVFVVGRRPGASPLLEAAGAYNLGAIILTIAVLQLDDLRMLPYAVSTLPAPLHALGAAALATVVALILVPRVLRPADAAVRSAVIALAAVLPVEVMVFTSVPSPYLPVSLVAVPALAVAIVLAVTVARRHVSAVAAVAVALLGAFVVAAGPATLSEALVESFQRSADPRKIIVSVMIGLGDEIIGQSAREDAETVAVSVRVRVDPGPKPAIGILLPVVISLRDPLGDRTVLDTSGSPVRDLGTYQAPREPPIDLGEVGIVEAGSFRSSGNAVDFRWTTAAGTRTEALADLRGSTVVIVSRTSFSDDSKIALLELQDYLRLVPAGERDRVVVLVITLNEDPARAAVVRPSASFRPLVAFLDTTGADAPEILRFAAVPVMWFVGPDGVVRHRIVGAPSREEIARGLAAAR